MSARIATGIRVNKVLWNRFKSNVREKGFSTCFIMETLLRGYLAGESHKCARSESVEKIVVNQNIIYEVARARRRKGLVRCGENCYLNGMWSYRAPGKGEQLSKLGHVSECACSVCRPRLPKRIRR